MSRRREHGDGGVDEYTTRTGKTLYRVSWYEPSDPDDPDSPKVRRFERGFPDRQSARDRAAEIRTQLKAGLPTRDPQHAGSLAAYLTEWVEGHRVAASTKAGYRKIIRLHINPHIGHLQLTRVTPATLARLYRKLETSGGGTNPTTGQPTGLGPNTVHKAHQVLSVALGSAQADGLIRLNPAKQPGANPPTQREIKRARRKMVVWTPQQLDGFLAHARQHDPYYPVWLLLSRTGLRRSEACELRWGDLDLAAGLLSVSRDIVEIKNKGQKGYLDLKATKNDEPRIIALDDATIACLKDHRNTSGKHGLARLHADQPVFLTVRTQRQIRPDHMTRRWIEAVTRYNDRLPASQQVPLINLHALRHTHASHLFAAGYQAKEIQARLGHETAAITQDLYTHFIPTSAAEQMRRYAEYMRARNDDTTDAEERDS